MILGILSDTHGFAARAAAAVRVLERVGATGFVHCGDVGAEDVLDEFAGRETWCVFGNIDDWNESLGSYGASIGVRISAGPLEFELGRKRLAVFHGHEAQFERLARALRSGDEAALNTQAGRWNYVCYGHTHRAADIRIGRLRLINPGALERARIRTVATLDLRDDSLTFWRVDEFSDPQAPPRRVELRELA